MNSNVELTISIVLYKQKYNEIKELLTSIESISKNIHTTIIDNGNDLELKNKIIENHTDINYFLSNNVGFGKAHNIAFEHAYIKNSSYHLILNPDVYFETSSIEALINFMNENEDVGLVMPKIRYPNGNIQHVCKLLPTPFDWIFRRFSPFRKNVEKRNEKYELRFTGYNKLMEVPSLSGCFMFVRTSVLKEVGGFDERFFMYAEDVDLCRRIGKNSKTVYYPEAEIIHNYEKGSYKNKKLLYYHIVSAIKYFYKWGWFFDKERKLINKKTLVQLGYKPKLKSK